MVLKFHGRDLLLYWSKWLRICLAMQGIWIWSLVEELRSHMPGMGQLSLCATTTEAPAWKRRPSTGVFKKCFFNFMEGGISRKKRYLNVSFSGKQWKTGWEIKLSIQGFSLWIWAEYLHTTNLHKNRVHSANNLLPIRISLLDFFLVINFLPLFYFWEITHLLSLIS